MGCAAGGGGPAWTVRSARCLVPQPKPLPRGELAQALFLGPRFWGLALGAWLSGPSFPKPVAQRGSQQRRVEPVEPVSLLHTSEGFSTTQFSLVV